VIEIEVDGIEELNAELAEITTAVGGPWDAFTTAIGTEILRYAVSISPVVTGAYQRAHEVVVGDKTLALRINPQARNPVSGADVVSYAGGVEARHAVYEQVYETAPSIISRYEQLIVGAGA